MLDEPVSKIAVLRSLYPHKTDGQLRGMIKAGRHDDLLERGRSTVLVIGDTHAPFTVDGYLEHCQRVYAAERCNRVVHIGDVASHHRTSYHESEVDAMSAEEELDKAIETLRPWANAFGDVDAVYGNHDKLIARKAKTGTIPDRWIRSYSDVLELPWRFHDRIEIDGVLYIHNAGNTPQSAATNALHMGQSVVGGHVHTRAGVVCAQGGNLFGCLTGCGVDRATYDQRYSTTAQPYVLSCAVVYGGVRAAVFPMT